MTRTIMTGFDPAAFVHAYERRGYDSLADLSRATGVGLATLYHWVKGNRKPQVLTLAKVATELDVPLNELIIVKPEARMLSYYRNIRGLTQTDCARLAKMPTSTWSSIERGEVATITDQTAAKFAAVLDISVDDVRAAFKRVRERERGTPP